MLDLSDLLVVVPGMRSGRVLLALIVDRAERLGLACSPPVVITPGELAGAVFSGRAGRPAGPIARRLAWIAALRSLEPDALAALVAVRPATADRRTWSGLGAMLERVHAELCGELILPGEVPQRAASCPGFTESARWEAISRAQDAYARALSNMGLHDDALTTLRAARDGAGVRAREVALVGVAELAGAARRALDATLVAGGTVTALIGAPEERRDLFDALGLVTPAWADAHAHLPADRIVFADSPSDQARRVLGAVTELGGAYPAHAITVGVPDDGVTPSVEREARRCGFPVRAATGAPLAGTPPGALVRAIADYLSDRSASSLVNLVKRPEVEAKLRDLLPPPRRRDRGPRTRRPRSEWWLAAMQDHASKSFQERPGPPWRTDSARRSSLLTAVVRATDQLLAELAPGRDERRPIGEWGKALLAVLGRLYAGVRCARGIHAQARLADACDAMAALVREVAEIPHAPGEADTLPAHDVLGLVIDATDLRRLAEPPRPDAAELLGWLELPLDPAPVLIVTGLNEGSVPAGSVADPFLPDSLRVALGLADDRRRLARDTFLLCAMAGPRERFLAICGRRREDGSPVVPSRVLMARPDGEALGLVLRYADPGREPPARVRASARLRPSAANGFLVRPLEPVGPVASLRVTAFRDYLASPYAFYLKHVLGLQEVCAPPPELGPAEFGSLLHAVLERFGTEPGVRDSDHPPLIRAFLNDAVSAVARTRFGASPPPAIDLQLRVCRRRLGVFAERQAARRREGWRIHAVEWSPERPVPFPVDGSEFGLRGKIDRIDVHEPTGEWAVLDYKTGENVLPPDKTHRSRAGWTDLQLPLYRLLAPAPESVPAVRLGYVSLAARPERAGFLIAPWTDSELDAADEAAREVVRAVRDGRFGDPGPRPPREGVFAALCGLGFIGTPGEVVA